MEEIIEDFLLVGNSHTGTLKQSDITVYSDYYIHTGLLINIKMLV